jgi:predicted nucleotidyltransferase component of viral defense system
MSAHKNIGASVRARLLNRAKDSGSDYGLILTKYALERILYRLSVSQWSDAFLLKGALLFDLWFDQPHRPTRDIDLLGFGTSEVDDVAAVFRDPKNGSWTRPSALFLSFPARRKPQP